MPAARNNGSLPRRIAQYLGFVYNDDGTWGPTGRGAGGPVRTRTPNTGSPIRRTAQYLGFVHNDDGAWGPSRRSTKNRGIGDPPTR